MPTRPRKPGEFCWINIITPSPKESCDFFGKLLGWTFGDLPGMGYMVSVGESRIGGLFDLNAQNTPPGTMPGIGVMVKVDSADATVARVKALGGTAKEPFDIGPQGRMAECYDPAGANFDLWQPKVSPGTDVDSRAHGAPSWFETMSTDSVRATKFYADLFGWTPTTTSMGAFDYTTFQLEDLQLAGMMPITSDMGPIPSHWGVYFTVHNADATATLAAELGGKVFIPPRDIPNVGRFCGLISPQGVRFYAIRYAI